MNFTVKEQKKFTQIILLKNLDCNVSDSLKKKLDDLIVNGTKNIVFDLKLSEDCDSSGLSAILKANRIFKNVGGVCCLINVSEKISKLIRVSQLETVLIMRPNLFEAENLIQENFVK